MSEIVDLKRIDHVGELNAHGIVPQGSPFFSTIDFSPTLYIGLLDVAGSVVR